LGSPFGTVWFSFFKRKYTCPMLGCSIVFHF
jgi:hypothetical protein